MDINYNERLHFASKYLFYAYCMKNNYKCPISISNTEKNYYFGDLSSEEKRRLLNKAKALQKRKANLKKRIKFMLLNNECLFCTFTLSDDYINNDLKTLKKYITRLLNDLECFYVGNVDFGENTDRLHFHFVVASDNKKFIKENYKMGFCDLKIITNKNSYKLANYIDKVVNHGLKDSTKRRSSLITPRGKYSFTNMFESLKYSNYSNDDYKDIYNSIMESMDCEYTKDFNIWN